eukprot:7288108-Pyramimonas_sp.AAC.1
MGNASQSLSAATRESRARSRSPAHCGSPSGMARHFAGLIIRPARSFAPRKTRASASSPRWDITAAPRSSAHHLEMPRRLES